MDLKYKIRKLNSQLDSILVKQGYIQFSATKDQVHSMYTNVFPVKAKDGSSSILFSEKYFGCKSGFICFNLHGLIMQLYVYNASKDPDGKLSGDVFDGFRCLSSREEIRDFFLACKSIYKPLQSRGNTDSSIMINVSSSYSDTSILFSLDNGKSIVFNTPLPPPHD